MNRRLIAAALAAATALLLLTSALSSAAPLGAVDPSGKAMPVGNLPGWRQVMADNFKGHSLGRCWGAYSEDPVASSPTSIWLPSDVKVGHGMATLEAHKDRRLGADQWVSAGISSGQCISQKYGKYEVRFRMNKGSGVKYTMILWPSNGNWPCGGEIDFGGDGGGNRSSTALDDIYCGGSGGAEQAAPLHVHANFSRWQTLGIEWMPHKLVWTLNGRVVGRIRKHIPSDPMKMDIQTETNTTCGQRWFSCIKRSTPANVNMQIDWVTEYAYDPHLG